MMGFSIILPTFNEATNIAILIDKIKEIFRGLNYDYEIIVVDAGSKDNTFQIAKDKGAKVFIQEHPGYGGALREAIQIAKGKYIITMDADFSHNPYIIKRLFFHRDAAHIVIASRYVRGGLANMPISRRILSTILNRFLSTALSLPLRDISSGFRLYNAEIFDEIDFSERDFNVLIEILVKAYMNGFKVKEIPFHYQPRSKGRSHARIIRFGLGYLRTFFKLWKVRNTIAAADYDERAFYSRIPLQRFWQRKRYKIICGYAGYPRRILDAGCGTSKILGAFPQAIGLDINLKKLRYNLSLGNPLVNADIKDLPFKDAVFDEIICSQVIEHLKQKDTIFEELKRVLKKGGILILGTPDYSRLSWRIIEWLYKKLVPGGYADEHISHYTRGDLVRRMENMGFKMESYKYILGSELICKFAKVS
ncbi:MAG: glycosyltransferase [Candidatus Omnitrophota bacterium]